MKFNKIRFSTAQIHLLHDVSSVTIGIGIGIQRILQASYYYPQSCSRNESHDEITMINYYHL
jgi:hypothetical protein